MNASRVISVGLLVVALITAVFWAVQRESTLALEQEVALLRQDARTLQRLRSENARLKAEQAPAAEVLQLEADRAALIRLRAEIQALNQRTEQRALEIAKPVSTTKPKEQPKPALALRIGVTGGGGLSLDGSPVELEHLKQEFTKLNKGDLVAVRLKIAPVDPGGTGENIKQSIDQILGLAKELGLKMTLQMEQPGS